MELKGVKMRGANATLTRNRIHSMELKGMGVCGGFASHPKANPFNGIES